MLSEKWERASASQIANKWRRFKTKRLAGDFLRSNIAISDDDWLNMLEREELIELILSRYSVSMCVLFIVSFFAIHLRYSCK